MIKTVFTCINYDGNVRTDTTFTVIGGTEAIETGMQKYLTTAATGTDRDLAAALQLGLEAWAVGKELSSREPEEAESEETQIDSVQMHEIIAARTGRR